jgi:glycerate dehydrogenase
MKIVVLDGHALNPGDLSWEGMAALGEFTLYPRTSAEHTLSRCRDADIVLTNKVSFSAATLDQLPRLRLIAVNATGYNNIDTAAAARNGVKVCNVPAYSTDSVAQLVFAMILEHASRVGLHNAAVQAGEWVRSPDFVFWKSPLMELAGKTMGIAGFGNIGRKVGDIANAFGMRVLAYNRSRRETPAYANFSWADLSTLLRDSDVVSLHLPQTPETTGLINHARLKLMKPSALLVNTGRGGLIVEQDLADALRAGVIAGAAVDVISSEPMPAGHPLLGLPNCLITPHIGWATVEARRRCMTITTENVRSFIAGEPRNVVN